MRILLLEDHGELRRLIGEHLSGCGFAVDALAQGADALTALRAQRYDALVLDLGLPDMDGLEVLARARALPGGAPPVLILTARDSVDARVLGLNAGADDYLVKPFDLAELEARLRAVLRRPGGRAASVLSFGALDYDRNTRLASAGGAPLELTRRETGLLEELLSAKGRVVVKDLLEERLYAGDEDVSANALEAAVSRLRRKLAGAGLRIETQRGIGYRLMREPGP